MRVRLAALLLAAASAGAAARAAPATDAKFETIVAAAKAQMLADPRLAQREASAARHYAEGVADPAARELMQATADWLAGEAYTRTGDNAHAAPLIEQAVRVAARVAPGGRLHADALLSRGSIEAADGRVGAAMTDFHAAHGLFQKLGDARSRARTFTLIATLYYDANDRANALRYFGQALDVYNADPGLEIAIRNGRGIALRDLKRFGEAAAEFAAALKLARAMNSATLTATILNNVARVALAQRQLKLAGKAIAESAQITRAAGAPTRRQDALAARLALEEHDVSRAEPLIARAFAGVDLTRTELADREAHQTAYDTYHALGRDALAFAHLTAFKRLDDEATELARSNGAALMAARFDFANQEVRIANLKADDLAKSVAYERTRARTQKSVLLGGVAATLLIIAALAYALATVRRSRDRVRAANVTLESTNAALGKALAAKTEFLATTSHEIRTPLNGILGMTQVMLADPKVDGATRDRVSVVHGAGVTMRALVDDILDVAKMETGNLTIEDRPFDLCAALTESTRLWEEQARAKGLAFGIDLRDCPGAIVADPGRLRQIVFNLLSNALKFTPAGSVALRARRCAERRFEIEIRDTGIGIAPDRHEQIFESFQQADASMTRQFGGTGLGLTICRNLARAMGGEVTVESEEGGGAVFTLTLPLRDAAPISDRAVAGTPIGLLLIETNPIARAKLKSLLEATLAPVEAVGDVASASAVLASRRCRTVLADDGALGNAAAAPDAIRALYEAGEGARIVVLRRADGVDGATLIEAGAALVLDRPIARDALIAALGNQTSGPVRPVAAQAA